VKKGPQLLASPSLQSLDTVLSCSLLLCVPSRQVATYLLGGLVPIILLPPKLGLHLETYIFKVHISVHWLDVALGHVVGGPLPLLGMQKVGKFLPREKARGGVCLGL
jgi:hypothetical protein